MMNSFQYNEYKYNAINHINMHFAKKICIANAGYIYDMELF